MKKLFKVMMALLLTFGVVACSKEKDNNTTTKDGKTFTVAMGGKPKDLDPVLGGDSITNLILAQMYEGLYATNQDGSLRKVLAKETTVSDDGLTYTFQLVEGAVWSDGQPVTAHDFEYGIKRSIHVSNAYGDDASYMQLITDYIVGAAEAQAADIPVAEMTDVGVKATGDYTLEITLKKVTPYYELLLTANPYLPARSDFASETEATWANSADCPSNGPFKVQSVDVDSKVVLVKNDKFRNAADVKLETINYLVMEDQEAQMAAFQTGEIDLATSVNTESVIAYSDQSAVWAIDPFVVNYYVLINSANCDMEGAEALKDVRVRQALSYALDRQAILQAINGGDYYYELNGFVPKGMVDADGNDFRTNADAKEKLAYYDLDKAKALLKEAGYDESHPLKLEYYYNQSTMHNTAAESIQASWKLAGIDVQLRTNDVSTFFSERASGKFELARHAMSADYNDPNAYLDMYLTVTQTTPAVSDAHYDELLARANSEMDPVKRSELLHEAEHYLIAEQMYVIPLFGYSTPYLLNPNFTAPSSSPDGHVYLSGVSYKG